MSSIRFACSRPVAAATRTRSRPTALLPRRSLAIQKVPVDETSDSGVVNDSAAIDKLSSPPPSAPTSWNSRPPLGLRDRPRPAWANKKTSQWEEESSDPRTWGPLADVFARENGDILLKFEQRRQPVAMPASVLRDICNCPKCVDPHSGQKSFSLADVPHRLRSPVLRVSRPHSERGNGLEVCWLDDPIEAMRARTRSMAPDLDHEPERLDSYDFQDIVKFTEGPEDSDVKPAILPAAEDVRTEYEHESFYDLKTLLGRPHRYEEAPKPPLIEWHKDGLEDILSRTPKTTYAEWMAGGDAFWHALFQLSSVGILFLEDVPAEESAVTTIAKQIGTIQTTFYGESWDVRSKPAAENIAYTNEYLGLHQDLLYMDSVPRVQILHCLENNCEGGNSLFADGSFVARRLQVGWPQHFKSLAARPVNYAYLRGGHAFSNSRPVVRQRPNSQRNALYWAPPFMAAWSQWSVSPTGQAQANKEYRNWKRAAHVLARELDDPHHVFELKMAPGRAVLFDNRRVLHGRRQFDAASGSRWLKGTYVGNQTLESKLWHAPKDLLWNWSAPWMQWRKEDTGKVRAAIGQAITESREDSAVAKGKIPRDRIYRTKSLDLRKRDVPAESETVGEPLAGGTSGQA
jgi:gamma-butyrobetaine dioxygenase